MKTLLRSLTMTLLAIAAVPAAGLAQGAYPTKPVRLVIPYGPGGATDIVGRVLAERLEKIWKQPVVVENKSGANGIVAIQDIMKSPPDGYNILLANITTNLLNPIVNAKQMPVDVFTALRPVAELASVPAILVGTKVDFPPNTVAELVAYAKAHPGEINHNIAGIGSYSHFDFLMLQRESGTKLTGIPLREGAGSGQIDVINGAIQIALTNAATASPLVQGGQLKALAVTGAKRLAMFPDVPTMAEAGFAEVGTKPWQILFVRADTPDAIVDAINKASVEAINTPEARKALEPAFFTIETSVPPNVLAERLAKEREQWTKRAQDFAEQLKAQ